MANLADYEQTQFAQTEAKQTNFRLILPHTTIRVGWMGWLKLRIILIRTDFAKAEETASIPNQSLFQRTIQISEHNGQAKKAMIVNIQSVPELLLNYHPTWKEMSEQDYTQYRNTSIRFDNRLSNEFCPRNSYLYLRPRNGQKRARGPEFHLTLSLPSSKSAFSQPFKDKCISEIVRIW